MSEDLPQHLARLGLDRVGARVYVHLLGSGPATPTEIGAAVRLDPGTVCLALSQLVQVGLVAGDAGRDDPVQPVQPHVGIDLLARQRESELRASQAAALTAYDQFRRAVWSQSTDDIVEAVTGNAIPERIRQIEETAEREIRRFDTPPYYSSRVRNPVELDKLADGVSYRVIYARSAVERTDYYTDNIKPCIAAGEEARVLPTVPVKMTIVDDRIGLVSLPVTRVEVNRVMLVVHATSLLCALGGLFDSCWRTAFPMHRATSAPSALRPLERQLLAFLAAGLPDNTIADRLSVSRRTLTRHVERLMCASGATNRFQLALAAARNGWL